MSDGAALNFVDEFFSVRKSYRVCFFCSLIAWCLQILALGTQNWFNVKNSSVGLWTHCNYTLKDFKCCQPLDDFLKNSYSIYRLPAWLTAVRTFEIFGLVTSFIFAVTLALQLAATDSNLKGKAKISNYFLSALTVIFVGIGIFISFGMYENKTWLDGALLSSSFGICSASAILHLFCFLLLFVSNDDAVQTIDVGQRWSGPSCTPGTNEFWEEIIDHPTTPLYWNMFGGGYHVKRYILEKEFCKTKKTSPSEFNAVKDLVEYTWDKSKVGIGADARNIRTNSISVTDVERIENVKLWYEYVHARETLLRNVIGGSPFEHLNTMSRRGPVLTSTLFRETLTRELYSDLNEVYLFHGTKPELVDNIKIKGMDPRHSSDQSMMGRGNYFAESSTKSDQYADNKNNRREQGFHMFLVRVLLGNIYLAKDRYQYKLPPCTACLNDECKNQNHEHFDSVVADIGGSLFREFIVYDANQCYPEYIITYNRK